MPCTTVAPVALISSAPIVVRLEPTGATPRILVPVTTTSSTGVLLAACANAAEVTKGPIAHSASVDPASLSFCRRYIAVPLSQQPFRSTIMRDRCLRGRGSSIIRRQCVSHREIHGGDADGGMKLFVQHID